MKTTAIIADSARRKIVRRIFAGAGGCLVLGLTALAADDGAPAQKLSPPVALVRETSVMPPGIFEKQFRIDTGESSSTRRVEFDRRIEVKVGVKERRIFKFDLGSWPELLRPHARLWVAVSAPAAITTEGPLHVSFSQGGVGMATGIDNRFSVDGVILMGCDYAVREGEVAVEIDNANHLAAVPCTLHAIVYFPGKTDPVGPEKN